MIWMITRTMNNDPLIKFYSKTMAYVIEWASHDGEKRQNQTR